MVAKLGMQRPCKCLMVWFALEAVLPSIRLLRWPCLPGMVRLVSEAVDDTVRFGQSP